MAAVTICSDFGAQEKKVCHCLHCFPIYLPWSDGTECHDLIFFECWVLSQLFHSALSLHQEVLWFFFDFCHKGGVICISEVIDISPGNLDFRLCFSNLAFHMMYSAYKLNKQDDNIQPWRTPFPIWSQSVVPYPVLTVASWPAYRFLRRWVRWSGIPISFRIVHSLLWSTQSKALA